MTRWLLVALVAVALPSPYFCQYGAPAKGKKPSQHTAPSAPAPAVLASPEQLGVSYSHSQTADYNANPFLNGGISLSKVDTPQHAAVSASHTSCSGAGCAGKQDYSQNPFLSGQVHTDPQQAQSVSQGSYGAPPKQTQPSFSAPPKQDTYPAPQKPKPFYGETSQPAYPTQQASHGGGGYGSSNNVVPPQQSGPGSVPCDPGNVCVSSAFCNNGFVNQNNVNSAKPQGTPCPPEEGYVCCSATERQGGPPVFVQQQQQVAPQTPSLVQVRPNQPSPGFVQQQNNLQNQIRVTQRPSVTYAPQAPYTGPLNTTPHPGCAAALKCVPLEYCTWEGVMSEQPVILSRQEDEGRVPLSECSNPETGIVGKCCRDPNYKDPWPDMLPGGGCYEGTACEPMETCDNDRMAQPKATCNLVQQGGVGICCIQRRKVGSANNQYQQQTSSSQLAPQRPQNYPQAPVQSNYPPPPPPQQTYPKPPVQQAYPSAPPTQASYPPPPKPAAYPQPQYPQDQYKEGSHVSTGVTNQVIAAPPPQQVFNHPPQPKPVQPQQPAFVQKPAPQQPAFVQQQPAFVEQQQQQQPAFVQEKVDPPFVQQEISSQHVESGFASQQTVSRPDQGTHTFTQTTQTFNQEQPAHTSFFQQQSPAATAQPASGYPRPQQQQQHAEASHTVQQHVALVPQQYPELSEQTSPGQLCGVRRVSESSGFSGEDGQTVPGEFPWLALVTLPSNRSRLCAGALISDKAVLASAHCVLGLSASDLQVEVGSWLPYDRNHPERQLVNVAAVARHPSFEEGSLSSDMAVLLLVHPVNLGRNVDLVCLPEASQLAEHGGLRRPGGACVMSSWPKNGGTDGFLHRVAMSAVPKAKCEESLRSTYLGKYFQLNKSFMCALPVNPQRDICTVGLGGPLVCPLEDGRYVVTAASSWDVGCQERAAPSVLCAVDVAWVNEVLARPLEDFVQAPADQRVDVIVDPNVGKNKPGFSQGYGRR